MNNPTPGAPAENRDAAPTEVFPIGHPEARNVARPAPSVVTPREERRITKIFKAPFRAAKYVATAPQRLSDKVIGTNGVAGKIAHGLTSPLTLALAAGGGGLAVAANHNAFHDACGIGHFPGADLAQGTGELINSTVSGAGNVISTVGSAFQPITKGIGEFSTTQGRSFYNWARGGAYAP